MRHNHYVAVQAYTQRCTDCSEIITHPLCPACIATGIRHWMHDTKTNAQHVIEHLEHFITKTRHHQGITCVACTKKRVHTCPTCFTSYVHTLLKQSGAGVRTMAQFLFIFNFDFTREVYTHEFECYGGY